MIINISDTIKNLYFVGDVHANYKLIIHKIQSFNIKDSVFIFCGDVGIGFEKLQYYTSYLIPTL